MKKIISSPYLKFIILGIVLLSFPTLNEMGLMKSSTLTTMGTVLIYALIALGFSMLMGYAGLISLGTSGFMGLGAYAIAYLTQSIGIPFIYAFFLSLLIPLIIGLIVGLVSLRVEGMYLAIATLGISEILRKSFIEFIDVTGGPAGFILTRYPTILGFQTNKQSIFYLIVIVLIIGIVVMHHITNSRFGRAFLAMRGSEAAAQAMGVNLLYYRLLAFFLATLYAIVGGVLYVSYIRYISPNDFDIVLSLNVLAIIIVGGQRSIFGVIAGSFVVVGFSNIVLKQLPIIGQMSGITFIFSGLILVIVLLFYPAGLVGLFYDLQKFYFKAKLKLQEVIKNVSK
jgi:branched-chain amino acid transport system permease protein